MGRWLLRVMASRGFAWAFTLLMAMSTAGYMHGSPPDAPPWRRLIPLLLLVFWAQEAGRRSVRDRPVRVARTLYAEAGGDR